MVSISPLSGDVVDGAIPAEFPPPFNFKPLKGEITDVRIGAEQIIHNRIHASMSLAKIAGIKYEEEFLNHLRGRYPQALIRPHIHFRDNGVYRTVIPDAILIGFSRMLNTIVILEVKSQHMPEAWWQLMKLYRPVLQAGFQNFNICCVEVVKRYDPQLRWPTEPAEHVLYEDLKCAVETPLALGILKWRKPTTIRT